MNQHDSTPKGDDVELPDEMVRDLNALFAAKPAIDSEVNDRIMAAAGEHLGRMNEQVAVTRRTPKARWVAIAASLAACVAIMALWPGTGEQAEPSAVALATDAASQTPEDIDGNGRVDILDALVLARRLEDPQSLSSDWDFNGDGTIDKLDVRQVAQSAVRLRPENNRG